MAGGQEYRKYFVIGILLQFYCGIRAAHMTDWFDWAGQSRLCMPLSINETWACSMATTLLQLLPQPYINFSHDIFLSHPYSRLEDINSTKLNAIPVLSEVLHSLPFTLQPILRSVRWKLLNIIVKILPPSSHEPASHLWLSICVRSNFYFSFLWQD